MKGTLEKLLGREISLRTVDCSDLVATVSQVNDDSFIVKSADGTSTLIPFASVAMLSFK